MATKTSPKGRQGDASAAATPAPRSSRDYPRILVPPPGPKAQKIIALDNQYSSPSYIKEYPLVMASGRGAMVEDVDGNRYIDFMAGIAVSSTGYNHPKIVAAVREAAGRFLHICGTDFYYEGMARLCERLAKLAPGQDKKRVFLTNSGTEAVEGAVKLARYSTGRPHLIAFDGAFHGRSYAAISLTASKVKYRKGFGPLLPEITHLPYDNPYRGVDGLAAAKRLFESRVDPSEIAAVIMEPIQGEGGYILPRPEFLRGWRELCDEHKILLVFDEIQSGVGRTGKMWAADYYGVQPDILLAAKGLGSGMPIGAIVAREWVMNWPRGSHGTTFGGNPVCCAAALATLDEVENGLCANAAKVGERLLRGLKALQEKHLCIGDVRGTGLMIGVEFVKDRGRKEPATDLVGKLEQLAFRKGLLLLSCGQSVIRIAPPLVLTPYDADTGLAILDECLSELS
ncbi:MAG: acetyl ornithine aminotransferase family protein [Elusimicrobia bacterium]|nr:acetyl ornithine aminotransferase family protein [Elusimicrobiota bacterium]